MRWLAVLAAFSAFAQDSVDAPIARRSAGAAAAMKSGNYAQAEQLNREIVRLRPDLAEARINLGLSCFLQKKYPAAIQSFEAGLKSNPGLSNAWLFIGISRFKMAQPAAALEPLGRYVTLAPADPEGHYYLALSHLALEQYPPAERALLAARKLAPRNVDVLYHLAQTYLAEAKQDPARRDHLALSYQGAIEDIGAIDPGSFRLAQLRAGYYELEGKKAQAIRELEAIFQHDPHVYGLHYTLGCLYMEAKSYQQARDQFEAELQLDAHNPRTYLQLGHVFVELNMPGRALPLLEKAAGLDPKQSGLIWVDIGRAYRSLDDSAKSVEAFEKAIRLGQNDASVYYQLATVARKAGYTARSREALAISQKLRNGTDAAKTEQP